MRGAGGVRVPTPCRRARRSPSLVEVGEGDGGRVRVVAIDQERLPVEGHGLLVDAVLADQQRAGGLGDLHSAVGPPVRAGVPREVPGYLGCGLQAHRWDVDPEARGHDFLEDRACHGAPGAAVAEHHYGALAVREQTQHGPLPVDHTVPPPDLDTVPVEPGQSQPPAVEPAVDRDLGVNLSHRGKLRVGEVPPGVPEHVLQCRGNDRAGRAVGAAQQRFHRNGALCRDFMSDRPVDHRGLRPGRPCRVHQSGRSEQVRHRVLPHHSGHGLDRSTQHTPSGVRIRPVLPGRRLGSDLLHQPGQCQVILAVMLIEPELQSGPQRHR